MPHLLILLEYPFLWCVIGRTPRLPFDVGRLMLVRLDVWVSFCVVSAQVTVTLVELREL